MAVVQVLSSGRTKDPFLGACIRNIWLIAAINDIDLDYMHIQGKLNCVADLLSMWQYTYANHIQLKNIYKIPYGVWLHKNYSTRMLRFKIIFTNDIYKFYTLF